MLQRLKPDEPKRVPAECVCPTGAETASRVAGVCCLITSAAMMTQCSPANVLAWVNRIFTHDQWHAVYFLAFTMNATSGELGRYAIVGLPKIGRALAFGTRPLGRKYRGRVRAPSRSGLTIN